MLNKLKNMFYAVFYGMKSGEIMTSSNTDIDSDGISIQQTIETNRLSHDLLKGEVTQQVEELRYRDYKVSEESKNYKYIGDGIAVKNKEKFVFTGKVKFTQKNNLICEGVLDGLNRVDSKECGVDKYVLAIGYKNIPRFKIEKYCERFDVDVNIDTIVIKLYINNIPNINEVTSKAFINELKTINKNIKNSFLNELANLFFVTQKVENEKEYVKYSLYDLILEGKEMKNEEFCITYKTTNFTREDLTEKFYSSTMDKKYEKKEAKEESKTLIISTSNKNTIFCEECGANVSKNDAYISKKVFGKVICTKCWEKKLLEDKLKEEKNG